MPSPPPPFPPPPGRSKSNPWPYIGAVVGLLLIVAIAGTAAVTFRRVKEKQAGKRAAIQQAQQEIAAVREELADSLESGEDFGSVEYMARMKKALEKSAGNLSGQDAAIMRAMAAYVNGLQEHAKKYDAALGRLTEAKVFDFEIADRATIAEHRKLIAEFAEVNESLIDVLQNSDKMVRAELVAARLSDRILETTVASFNKSRPQRELQLRIREQDRIFGQVGLATLDLLEKNWGQWSRDPATAELVFQNDATRLAFNELIGKIQAAGEKQVEVQQELAGMIRTMKK